MEHILENRYWFQAKGLDFQDYQHRPTYRAHCTTAKFAAIVLRQSGISNSGVGISDVETQFRMLRQFRTAAANALRIQVARLVRGERNRMRQFGRLMRSLSHQEYPTDYVRAYQAASKAAERGEIRAFSVSNCPERGRVIHYETDQGWNPDPAFCDFDPDVDSDPHNSSAW